MRASRQSQQLIRAAEACARFTVRWRRRAAATSYREECKVTGSRPAASGLARHSCATSAAAAKDVTMACRRRYLQLSKLANLAAAAEAIGKRRDVPAAIAAAATERQKSRSATQLIEQRLGGGRVNGTAQRRPPPLLAIMRFADSFGGCSLSRRFRRTSRVAATRVWRNLSCCDLAASASAAADNKNKHAAPSSLRSIYSLRASRRRRLLLQTSCLRNASAESEAVGTRRKNAVPPTNCGD